MFWLKIKISWKIGQLLALRKQSVKLNNKERRLSKELNDLQTKKIKLINLQSKEN